MKWLYFHESFTGNLHDMATWMRDDSWRKQWDIVSVLRAPLPACGIGGYDIFYRVTEEQHDEHEYRERTREVRYISPERIHGPIDS